MSSQITRLRKEGRLQEAYSLAAKSLQDLPDDPGLISELAWVYYAYFSLAAGEQSLSKMKKIEGQRTWALFTWFH